MTHAMSSISPLRQRMLDDMRMRKLAAKTQSNYLRAVQRFARFLGRSPSRVTAEELRQFQLSLVDAGLSPTALNGTLSGLKFFLEVTLDRAALAQKLRPVRVPRTLPVVLSPQEVARLIAGAGNLKHQTALSVAYGAGLRASEVVNLKVGDIDSQRMALRIEQGKGRKDRYAMLSPLLLERLPGLRGADADPGHAGPEAAHPGTPSSTGTRMNPHNKAAPHVRWLRHGPPLETAWVQPPPGPSGTLYRRSKTSSAAPIRASCAHSDAFPVGLVARIPGTGIPLIPIASPATPATGAQPAVSSLEACPTPAP